MLDNSDRMQIDEDIYGANVIQAHLPTAQASEPASMDQPIQASTTAPTALRRPSSAPPKEDNNPSNPSENGQSQEPPTTDSNPEGPSDDDPDAWDTRAH